jgi:hypothetical protein
MAIKDPDLNSPLIVSDLKIANKIFLFLFFAH